MSDVLKNSLRTATSKTISQLSLESSPTGCLLESINRGRINDLMNTHKIVTLKVVSTSVTLQ